MEVTTFLGGKCQWLGTRISYPPGSRCLESKKGWVVASASLASLRTSDLPPFFLTVLYRRLSKWPGALNIECCQWHPLLTLVGRQIPCPTAL